MPSHSWAQLGLNCETRVCRHSWDPIVPIVDIVLSSRAVSAGVHEANVIVALATFVKLERLMHFFNFSVLDPSSYCTQENAEDEIGPVARFDCPLAPEGGAAQESPRQEGQGFPSSLRGRCIKFNFIQ